MAGPSTSPPTTAVPLLAIEGLGVAVRQRGGWLPILSDISLDVAPRETLAIVGESGSGKSMLALSILRLLEPANGFRVGGRVAFDGRDVLAMSPKELQKLRGAGIAVVFQEALNALNPVMRIGQQIVEAITEHGPMLRARERHDAAIALLRDVGIPAPDERARAYPHELSGGMRQRAMIAIALAANPRLIIADEPTTSLDVTIQSQVLWVLKDLSARRNLAMIFISHNLGAVAAVADRIAVMYAGEIVEIGPAAQILDAPAHPYTRALLMATPRVDRQRPPQPIAGTVPPFDALPPGCRFAPRCPHRLDICDAAVTLRPRTNVGFARCVLLAAGGE